MTITTRRLKAGDAGPISEAFGAVGWPKPAAQFLRYMADQEAGQRVVLLAHVDGAFAGYVTLVWTPHYPPLAESGIPEIQDLNVLPAFRRRGVATRLLDEAEWLAAERSTVVGIGVGLYADYGAAQRLYVKRGYVPDGRGVTYGSRAVPPGESVRLDDDLVLHLTRRLRAEPCG